MPIDVALISTSISAGSEKSPCQATYRAGTCACCDTSDASCSPRPASRLTISISAAPGERQFDGDGPSGSAGAENREPPAGRIDAAAQALQKAFAVGVVAEQPIILPPPAVDGSHQPGRFRQFVEQRQHGHFMRHREIAAAKAHRPHPAHRVGQILGRDFQRQISPIEADAGKSPFDHVLRRVSSDGIAQQGNDLLEWAVHANILVHGGAQCNGGAKRTWGMTNVEARMSNGWRSARARSASKGVSPFVLASASGSRHFVIKHSSFFRHSSSELSQILISMKKRGSLYFDAVSHQRISTRRSPPCVVSYRR